MKNNPPMSGTVELGDQVQDTITGLKGIAVARTRWLTGCDRISVQAPAKDGKVPDLASFDEPMLRVIKPGKVQQPGMPHLMPGETSQLGGPRPTPSRY